LENPFFPEIELLPESVELLRDCLSKIAAKEGQTIETCQVRIRQAKLNEVVAILEPLAASEKHGLAAEQNLKAIKEIRGSRSSRPRRRRKRK